jgi:predicted MPP superfamily phosphohydrolase
VLDGRSAVDAAGRFVPVLRRLATPGVALGTFAVLGNHEAHAGHAAAAALFRRAGIRVLADEWVEAAPGLVLAGIVDHAWHHVAGEDPGRIDRALAGRPPGAATVFLSHRPGDAERVAAAGARSGSPVGLMLSGHTHGGQVWPFSYAAERVNPVFEGRYEVGGMPVVVTRGAGTWGPRMRLWKRGEILRITVRATATPTSSARAP